MTNELKPWLQDEGGDSTLKELLESAEVDAPSDRQLERLTAKVAFLFDLPPGGGGGGGDGGSGGPSAPEPMSGSPAGTAGTAGTVQATSALTGAASATGLGVGVKAFIAASVLGAAGVGVMVANRAPEETPSPLVVAPQQPAQVPTEPVKEPPPVEEPVVEAVKDVPPPPPVTVKKPVVKETPTTVSEKPPPPKPVDPDEELAGLDEAMTAARAGRPRDALAAVEAHATKFPKSALEQEREVIAIEALVTLGRPDDARARLSRFRAKWPTSSHLVRLDALLP